MNQELQKQLADMLAKLTGVVEQGASWTAAQIPPLVQEKIVYGRVVETLLLLVAVVAFGFCVSWCRACLHMLGESTYDDEVSAALFTAATGIGAVISFGLAVNQAQAVALVWFAPRLYAVEWLRTLIAK